MLRLVPAAAPTVRLIRTSACLATATLALLAFVATWPARAEAATSGAPGATQLSMENAVLALANAERAKVGCGALRMDGRLRAAARLHSTDMQRRRFFSHTNPSNVAFSQRILAQHYPRTSMGENIALGYRTPQAVMSGWMHSTGHRANLLNCRYRAMGVGAALGTGGPWWTQDFGGV